ncbi:hypothetical protein ACHQM5_000626 [Ranunculus cassubicifolius]
MEGKIQKMAVAYYANSSDECKEKMKVFFNSMDGDGNGVISLSEFKSYLKKNTLAFRPELFAELDQDRNGSLDFDEVVTFYYMVNVRNLFCACCEIYLDKEYYTCVNCFLDRRDNKSFNICLACYRNNQYASTNHENFIDNHLILKSLRSEVTRKAMEGKPGWTTADYVRVSVAGASTSASIVQVALAIAAAGACTIM